MGITSALVLYAVCWFMTFLIILPLRIQTQGDLGEIVPGTHAGSPEVHNLKRKAWRTTWIAFLVWAILFVIIVFEFVTVRDIDALMFDRMSGS